MPFCCIYTYTQYSTRCTSLQNLSDNQYKNVCSTDLQTLFQRFVEFSHLYNTNWNFIVPFFHISFIFSPKWFYDFKLWTDNDTRWRTCRGSYHFGLEWLWTIIIGCRQTNTIPQNIIWRSEQIQILTSSRIW